MEKHFSDAVILEDNYFGWGCANLANITFHTTWAIYGKKKKKNVNLEEEILTKEKKDMNEAISKVRGRIERIFGHFSKIFDCLNCPFREDE